MALVLVHRRLPFLELIGGARITLSKASGQISEDWAGGMAKGSMQAGESLRGSLTRLGTS